MLIYFFKVISGIEFFLFSCHVFSDTQTLCFYWCIIYIMKRSSSAVDLWKSKVMSRTHASRWSLPDQAYAAPLPKANRSRHSTLPAYARVSTSIPHVLPLYVVTPGKSPGRDRIITQFADSAVVSWPLGIRSTGQLPLTTTRLQMLSQKLQLVARCPPSVAPYTGEL